MSTTLISTINFVNQRCLPPDLDRHDIRDILDKWQFNGQYKDIEPHVEEDSDVSWIVLFKSKADANACIKHGKWRGETKGGSFDIIPEPSLECWIPDKWTEISSAASANLIEPIPIRIPIIQTTKFDPTLPERIPITNTQDVLQYASESLDCMQSTMASSVVFLKVDNVPQPVSMATIKMFFENTSESGGGEIESIDIRREKNEAMIAFKDKSIVDRVLQKHEQLGKFILYGADIVVSKYTPIDIEQLKLFVINIAEATTSESLLDYIEAICKMRPHRVTHGNTPGTAMIIFANKPDVTILKSECRRKPLDNYCLEISDVQVTRSIKVKGFPTDLSPATLGYYFENKKRSGGGAIESTVYQQTTQSHIVTFRNPMDARRVNNQQIHSIDTRQLSVELYYPCMDIDPSLSFKIPKPKPCRSINTYLIRFWSTNPLFKKHIEDEIRDCFGRISWPAHDSDDCMVIYFDVNIKDRHIQSKVEKWTNECGKCVRNYKELFTVCENIYVAEEVWIATIGKMAELDSNYATNTALFLPKDEKSLIIVGLKTNAAERFAEIKSIVTELEQELSANNQTITKIRKLKAFQVALLNESKLIEYLKKNRINHKLDNKTGEIELQGKIKDVNDALKKLEQTLQEIVEKGVAGLSKSAKDLLSERAPQTYIQEALKKKKVDGVWDVVSDDDLVVYSWSESDAERAWQIIRDCIKAGYIPLDSQMEKLVKSPAGKEHIFNTTEKYDNQFKIEYGKKEIRLTCIISIYDDVYRDIEGFLDLHKVTKESLKVDPEKLRYIMQFKRRQLEDIETQNSKLYVRIERVDTADFKGFKLYGKKDDVKLAISDIQDIVDTNVIKKEFKLETPGIEQFVCSVDGRDEFQKIEMKTKCVLHIDSSSFNGTRPNTTYTKTCKENFSNVENSVLCDGKGNLAVPTDTNSSGSGATSAVEGDTELRTKTTFLKLDVVLGSLENQNVDVIVNSTNQNMDLNIGVVSKQLLKAGGDVLLKECLDKCPPNGIEVGDVVVTSGGDMKCLKLFHGLINKWDESQESENVLEYFMWKCLEKADRKGMTSIAFPALGTGVLGFPASDAARIMFSCVSKFSATHIKSVLFVVWGGHPENVKAFQDEEVRFGQLGKTVKRRSFREDIISEAVNHPYTKTIAGLTIEIEQGDITKEKTDLIVNSTVKHLNLKSGAVSRAILIAAGDTVQAECKSSATHQIMNKTGFVFTSAGRLFSKGIVHVKAVSSTADWEKVIKKCMELADKKEYSSISFPALGTGGKACDPAAVAKAMYRAFKSYSHSLTTSHCVKKVRIVIYQPEMVDIFTDAMEDHTPLTRRASIFQSWFGGKPKKDDEVANSGVMFHIYSDSDINLTMAQKELDALYKTEVVMMNEHAKHLKALSEAQVHILKLIGEQRHVTIDYDAESGEVRLQGYGNAVHDIKYEIQQALFKM